MKNLENEANVPPSGEKPPSPDPTKTNPDPTTNQSGDHPPQSDA